MRDDTCLEGDGATDGTGHPASYVLRVYRAGDGELAGILMPADSAAPIAFRNATELLALLAAPAVQAG
jgi:hypothetical protein